MTTKKKKSPMLLAVLALMATVVAFAIGEVVVRMLPEPGPQRLAGQLTYRTIDNEPTGLPDGIRRGAIVPVDPGKTPRPRHTWAPGESFYLCYSDHDTLPQDWMDEQGRVLVRINQFGIRERDSIAVPKPAGQRRIVCVGDSFTFGWGVPEERGWVRLLEQALRADDDDVRTVNCGAAGALLIDEYWWALRHRFAQFEPDAVIVTICLNDLIPCSGLFVQGPAPDTGSKLLDLMLGALGHTPFDLDPSVDWVDLLMGLPATHPLYTGANPHDAMWAQGRPQRALAAMKAWCHERGIKLMVILWPFLQGLGPGRWYPFSKLHGLVAAECKQLDIPFLDVLPALRDTPHEELWVTPADMHANPRAIRQVMPLLVPFVRKHL